MSSIPYPHTSDHIAVNLVSTATHQFAIWVTLASELRVGRIERGVQRWGIDHDEYEFGGTPRTVLGLPNTDDDHNFPSIAVDGLGRLHVLANMNVESGFRAVKSVDPHTSDTWMTNAGWATAVSDFGGIGARTTYPIPVNYPDGTLQYYLRDGSVNSTSGKSDSHYWTRTPSGTTWASAFTVLKGLSVTDAGGPGIPGGDDSVDDDTNWSAYMTKPVVESPRGPHPGRLHLSWVWRVKGLSPNNVMPGYGYSDDKGVTWKAVDGTSLTVPITPMDIPARFPGSARITAISRTSNVVTAELDTPSHGIVVGDDISVTAMDTTYNTETGTTYNGTFTVASTGTPTANSVTWAQTAANDAAGGVGSISKYQYINYGNLAVDDEGLPHIISAATPAEVYIRRNANNSGWLTSTLPNPLGGIVHLGRKNLYWWRGHLWALTTTWPADQRRQRLIRITAPGPEITLSGNTGNSGWEPSADPEAWRRFGTIESLAPDGDTPRVFVFGRGANRATA